MSKKKNEETFTPITMTLSVYFVCIDSVKDHMIFSRIFISSKKAEMNFKTCYVNIQTSNKKKPVNNKL